MVHLSERNDLIDNYWRTARRYESNVCTGSDQTTLVTVIAKIVRKLVMWWMFSERKLKVVVVWFILDAEAQG